MWRIPTLSDSIDGTVSQGVHLHGANVCSQGGGSALLLSVLTLTYDSFAEPNGIQEEHWLQGWRNVGSVHDSYAGHSDSLHDVSHGKAVCCRHGVV